LHLLNYLVGKDSTLHVRVILNHFRFSYRFIYQDLIESIIKTS
jgi:hypothetical protein